MATVLFIEDEPTLQKALGDLLESEGFKVMSAMDGAKGVKLAKEKGADLILLDLVLPKKHGLEVLQELKEGESTKDIPVIVLTNVEELEEIDKAIKLGARTYLVKTDFTLTEVFEKVKEAISE
ncbi:MAG: response regulator [Candidatus Nealsonbacteria bacterium]|nr:response regulator [Candidatus Nealsonbacteria bacterium]